VAPPEDRGPEDLRHPRDRRRPRKPKARGAEKPGEPWRQGGAQAPPPSPGLVDFALVAYTAASVRLEKPILASKLET
jgi:hypothetical protein